MLNCKLIRELGYISFDFVGKRYSKLLIKPETRWIMLLFSFCWFKDKLAVIQRHEIKSNTLFPL